MKHSLRRLMFLAATVLLSGTAMSQGLADNYTFASGVDASRWITLPADATQIINPSTGDNSSSGVFNMGFWFVFGNGYYNQFSANEDGTLRLGPVAAAIGYDWQEPIGAYALSQNLPKINGFGHDGSMNDSSYVRYFTTVVDGDSLLVVEYALSDLNDESRLLKFQVQLNGGDNSVTLVYAPADSASFPSDDYQFGLATSTNAVAFIDVEGDSVSWLTSACTSFNSPYTWPEAYRYYTFSLVSMPCIYPSAVTTEAIGDSYAVFSYMRTNASVTAEYGEADFEAGAGEGVSDATSPVVLTDLTPSTDYRIDFTFFCPDGSEQVVSHYFRTTSIPVSEFPYTNGFEEDDDMGWDFFNGTNGWAIGSADANGGTQALYISADGGTTAGYTINSASYSYASRDIRFSEEGQYGIYFDWKCYAESCCDYLRAFLVPSSVDISTLSNGYISQTGTPANWINLAYNEANGNEYLNMVSTWTTSEAIVNIFGADTGTYHLLFYWRNDGSVGTMPGAEVDNLVVQLITCPQPYNVELDSASTNDLYVHWSPAGDESEWVLCVGEDTSIVSSSTVTISGLNASQGYTIKVAALCGADDTSRYSTLYARTACGEITLPYLEDFENSDLTTGSLSYHPCWDYVMIGGTSMPYITTNATYATSGTHVMYLRSTGIIVLPEVTDEPVSALQLKFYAYMTSTSYALEVGVMEDDSTGGTVFVPIDTIQVSTASGAWHTTYFDSYTGTSKLVALRSFNIYGYTYSYIYIDDVELSVAPPCHTPTNITFSDIDYSSAVAHWDANGASQWGIEYGEAGFEFGDGTEASADVDTLAMTGLQPGTRYDFYLFCTNDDGNGDTVRYRFTTLALPIEEFPYVTGFEDEEDAAWAVANGSNAWVIDSAVSRTGSYSLYISNDGGASNAYSGSTARSYASRVLHITEPGSYEMYFDWKCYGESSFDYLRAFLVPGIHTFTGDEYLGITSNAGSEPEGWISMGLYNGMPRLNASRSWESTEGFIRVSDDLSDDEDDPDLSSAIDTGYYTLMFYWANDGSVFNQPPAAVDNIWFGIPTCPRIWGLAADSISSNSIDLSWNAGGDEAEWEITVNDTMVYYASSPEYQLTGLDPYTVYNISVRAVCSDDDTARAVSISVKTPCLPVSVPYYQDFDSLTTATYATNIIPDCWDYTMTVASTSTGIEPMVYGYANYASSGIYTMRLYYSAITTLPPFDRPANELQLDFSCFQSANTYWLIVGVMEGSNFIPIDTVVNTYTNIAEPWTVYFADYTGNSNTIAFYNYNPNGYMYSYNYIDDVAVTVAPDCLPPTRMRTDSLGADAARFSWRANGGTAWTVEYGPRGFTPGTGTSFTTTTNNCLLTGLTEQTHYDVYVVSNCTSSNSPAAQISFRTRAYPVTDLPYITGFEVGEDQGWDFVNGLNEWVVDSATSSDGTFSMYISNDGGASNTYGNSTCYSFAVRDIVIPAEGDYFVSYDWKCFGESSFDYARAMLAPGTAEIMPASDNGINYSSTPAGWINIGESAYGMRLNQQGSWTTYEGIINIDSSRVGANRLVFFWRNDGSVSNQPPIAIDNFVFGQITCYSPSTIVLDSAGENVLELSWTPGGNETEWEVTVNDDAPITTTSTSVQLTGLEASSVYRVKVRGICGGGDTAFYYRRGTFRTSCGTMTLTVDNPYEDSFEEDENLLECWQMVYADESSPNEILINSSYARTGSYSLRFSSYSSASDYTQYAISPRLEASDSVMLSFYYRGYNSYHEGFSVGYSTTTPDTSAFTWSDYYWMDEVDDYSQWDLFSATYPAETKYIAIRYWGSYLYYVYIDDLVISSNGIGCTAPVVTAITPTYNTIDLVVSSPFDAFEAIITDALFDETATPLSFIGTAASFTGLAPSTAYTIGLRSLCEEGAVSDWALIEVTTEELPCFPPTGLTVEGTSLNSVTLSWTPGGLENLWEVNIHNLTFDSTYTSATTTATFGGLTPNVQYSVRVRSLCGDMNEVPGEWIEEEVSFTTDICQPVSGVTVGNITTNSATVSWTAAANGNGSYTIEYGYQGMNRGEGTTVTVTTTRYVMENLEEKTSYDVYVMTNCSDGYNSVWSEVRNFATLEQQNEGIDDVQGLSHVSLYPNPASSNVTVSADGLEGEATVTVVDMNGRTVKSQPMAGSRATVDVSDLAQGAYFVRIEAGNANVIRKLIVR